jgi:NADH dehydrogenase
MPRVLVLGGTGFLGRHVVSALHARGHDVVAGTRSPRKASRRFPALRLLETHLDWLLTPAEWKHRLRGFDVVVNAVGILRERGHETYERVHHLAPAALSRACACLGIRLIHVSALGLSEAAYSEFIASKARGEEAVRKSGADYFLVRPSLLDGEGGFGARWLRRMARWPVHFTPAGASGKIAAVHVEDVANAIVWLCEPPVSLASRVVELGGTEHRTMAQLLAALRAVHKPEPALHLAVPLWLALIGSLLCDLAHFSPYSFGHLELMRRDNVPADNLLPALLGRPPLPVGVPAGAFRFRPRTSPVLRDAAGPAS